MPGGLSHWQWSWNPFRGWYLPTWRTSKALCWTPYSLPTGKTGQWIMQSTWDFTASCSTSTPLGQICLWTPARPSTRSSLTFHPAHCASFHLSAGHKLPDWQEAVGKITMCSTSSLLFSLYTNDCTPGGLSVKVLHLADTTTIICLMQDADESVNRWKFERSEQPGAEYIQNWEYNSGLQDALKSLVQTCPPIRTYTCPVSGNKQETSPQIHLTLEVTCSK